MDHSTPERGRRAEWPRKIPARGWLDIFWRVARRIMPSQIGLIAAGAAFYTLLAAFPAIAALMALAGLVTDPISVVAQLQAVTELLPDQAALILLNQAQLVAGTSDSGLSLTLWIGVASAIYLTTRATTSLIHGLNIAYDETEKRGIIAFWITVILLTMALLFGGVLLLLLLVGLPAALAFLPQDVETERWLRIIRWLVMGAVIWGGLAGLYRWGPSRRRAKWRWLTPGAAVAAGLWFAGTMGFTLYVSNFANYNETFGSLGGVIVLLTWFWLSAFVILLGALLDAEIEAQTAKDSTVGPDRPIGERGAAKADILGETFGSSTGDENASERMRIIDRFELAGRGTVILTDKRTLLPRAQPLHAVVRTEEGNEHEYHASKEWLLHQKGLGDEDEAFLLQDAHRADIPVGATVVVHVSRT